MARVAEIRDCSAAGAVCPEVDVASRGDTVAEVLALFFETAPAGEVKRRCATKSASPPVQSRPGPVSKSDFPHLV
ncbi:MAG: hypothetical protein F4128_13560 [Gammaproteobacteria bacterium]|nr:hypothetical protein [Gammaproteobacteria bacterium]